MREVSTTIWESFLAAGAWTALTAHRAARGDAASWPFPLMSQASLWCCFLVHRHFPLIVRQAGRQPHVVVVVIIHGSGKNSKTATAISGWGPSRHAHAMPMAVR
ncbi:hypothetical protein H0G86_001547 [Trichoderma simmonsii]|uniref:Uncharacterized protein n=1 Tax=Trichoderma simmonsii TaxID=1491479 RepID=A0A8G0L6G6_9HYPO|nr:hypothetical protein H0G86_001547 [Trichoderma simmonsii]